MRATGLLLIWVLASGCATRPLVDPQFQARMNAYAEANSASLAAISAETNRVTATLPLTAPTPRPRPSFSYSPEGDLARRVEQLEANEAHRKSQELYDSFAYSVIR